ncbi:DUF805 domain-containing protein [Tropicibacter oceani]|uniref:DUF805 domain-containing protein n=1 Tax=Tropicibacter oceani TaxID=3058420 RepID=A0ABY8QHK0_9RHOB|nr:DUF805 domain-containing protein [Tropicibacter oceani]WGW04014.1 DUF805 domain-containing protein [Tropicibacter oceani]
MFGPIAACEAFIFNAFNVSGRATRAEYWWVFLAQFLIYVVSITMDIWSLYVHGFAAIGFAGMLTPWLLLLFAVPTLTLTMRRLHDTGRSSFKIAVVLLPVIGLPLFGYYLVAGSDMDKNKWGEPRHPSGRVVTSAKTMSDGTASAQKHNPFASYAYLVNGEADPTPATLEARRAEISDYYRSRVLGQGA